MSLYRIHWMRHNYSVTNALMKSALTDSVNAVFSQVYILIVKTRGAECVHGGTPSEII